MEWRWSCSSLPVNEDGVGFMEHNICIFMLYHCKSFIFHTYTILGHFDYLWLINTISQINSRSLRDFNNTLCTRFMKHRQSKCFTCKENQIFYIFNESNQFFSLIFMIMMSRIIMPSSYEIKLCYSMAWKKSKPTTPLENAVIKFLVLSNYNSFFIHLHAFIIFCKHGSIITAFSKLVKSA